MYHFHHINLIWSKYQNCELSFNKISQYSLQAWSFSCFPGGRSETLFDYFWLLALILTTGKCYKKPAGGKSILLCKKFEVEVWIPCYGQNLVLKRQQFIFQIYATCSAFKFKLFGKIRVYKSNPCISIMHIVWKNQKVNTIWACNTSTFIAPKYQFFL